MDLFHATYLNFNSFHHSSTEKFDTQDIASGYTRAWIQINSDSKWSGRNPDRNWSCVKFSTLRQ